MKVERMQTHVYQRPTGAKRHASSADQAYAHNEDAVELDLHRDRDEREDSRSKQNMRRNEEAAHVLAPNATEESSHDRRTVDVQA